MNAIFNFTFYYPLLMAYTWIIGALFYYYHREQIETNMPGNPPELKDSPGISFLVPCHNEAANLLDWRESVIDPDEHMYGF